MRTWLALALVGTLGARTANAQFKLDLCRTAKPNATVTMSTAQPSVFSTSNGGSYFGEGCHRYVVDVVVAPTSKGIQLKGGAVNIQGGTNNLGFSTPGTQSACESYTQLTSVYRKNPGAAEFTRLSSVGTNPTWNGSKCVLSVPTFGPYEAGATYRIAVGVKIANSWHPVAGAAIRVPS
jgi:hypothetical protein